ncbi:MAG: hypothetical protein ACLFOY_12940 [Desulfatibacillaceae bacterium]
MPTKRAGAPGPGGTCVCPKCETRKPHVKGRPCLEESCPACGAKMLREGSEPHRRYLKQKSGQ